MVAERANPAPENLIEVFAERRERSLALIRAATVELLILEGPGGINIDSIARQCGVARTTVYRNVDNLDDLIVDAIRFVEELPIVEITDDALGDLVRYAQCLARELQLSEFGHAQAALAELANRTIVHTDLQAELLATRRTQLRRLVNRVGTSTDTRVVVERILAGLWFRHLVSHDSLSDRAVARLVRVSI